jgi:hypothetical protein
MAEAIWSLKAALRRLWADHVIWTRQYVVAAVGETPDVEAAAGRLLKNQEDIGGAIVPFYGQDAGQALTGLLKQHIMIAVDLIEAAKAGSDEKFKAEDAKWTKNAEEIAGLLSGANPNWPKKDVVDLLGLHLSLTKQEVVADGIVKQFPDRFKE